MKIVGIIPARYASTRFPGKPLVDILGKTMIQRVYEQVKKTQQLQDVVVATDDENIYRHVAGFGGKVVMTSAVHPTGTDRCCEALALLKEDYDYVINIQGDEPLIDPHQIDVLAEILNGKTELATLIKPETSLEVLQSSNSVKVVMNHDLEAIYFSRAMIPYIRGKDMQEWITKYHYHTHVGMYAYRKDVLDEITKLPPSSLEKAESLEQLRWLENGYTIKCVTTSAQGQCVDVPEDVDKVIALLKKYSL